MSDMKFPKKIIIAEKDDSIVFTREDDEDLQKGTYQKAVEYVKGKAINTFTDKKKCKGERISFTANYSVEFYVSSILKEGKCKYIKISIYVKENGKTVDEFEDLILEEDNTLTISDIVKVRYN